MAHTKVTKTYSQNTGVANTFSYSGSFDVFKGTEVVALLDAVALTYTASTINESASPREYTVDTSAKTIHIGGADLSSGSIEIRPVTDMGAPTPRADYAPGSSVAAADLNNNQLQLMRKAMEYDEQKLSSTGGTMSGDLTMGQAKSIIFEGASDDAYETTLTVTDPTADRTITLPNVTGTVVTTGDTGTVTATMLAANSVDSSELVDGSIDSSHISSNAVTTAKITADAVTGAKIADDAINSEHYTDGSIDTAHIADSQVTTAKLADNAITTVKITDANVTTAKIAADAITAAKIADDVVNSEHYAAASIDTEHIADSQVTTAKIAADAVTNAKIADDQIDSEHYVDGSIDTAHIGDNQVTTAKIADSNVTTAKIADDAVTTAKIADDAVVTASIANGAINNAKLADASLSTTKYQDDTITTAKISDSQITTAKIASDAVTGAKIADDAINSEHYTDASIDTAHIADGQVTAAKVASNAVTTAKITDSNVTTAKIADDAITIAKVGCEQTTISDSDSHIPTSGAVVDYVAAQIAPIGGLEVIADEDNFPSTQPASGVVISIADAAGIVVSGSGSSTTARTAGNGSDNVTINNFPSSLYSETLASGNGLMVTSTGSSNVYNYHKLLASESDVKQLSDDINDFNSRYRINAGEPGSNNDDGDLVWDTSADKMKVYDATASAWKEVTSSGDFKFLVAVDAGTTTAATFDGSDTSFDLKETTNSGSAASVTNINQLMVVLNGVVQKPNTGSYSASEEGFYLTDSDTIRFCTAPPSNSTCFIIQSGSAVSIPTPGDGTVTTAKIASGAVTTAKLADANVTTAKLADDSVTAAKIGPLAGDVTLDNGTNAGKDITWDESADTLKLEDSVYLKIGNGGDLSIYHDGSNSYIHESGTGDLVINSNSTVSINPNGGGEYGLRIHTNGAVDSYYDNSKKLSTDTTGIVVYGSEGNSAQIHIKADDGDDNPDLWRIIGEPSGPELNFQSYNSGNYTNNLRLTGDQGCELYYNNGIKLTTTNTGLTVAGDIKATYPLGRRNHLINGSMRVAAREGTTNTAINTYGPCDRWRSFGGALTHTATQVSSAIAYDSGYALRFQRNNGASETNGTGICNGLESKDSYIFAGKKVTLSFKAQCGANYSPTSSILVSKILTGEGTDQNPVNMTTTDTSNQNNTLSTSVQTFTHSHTIPDDKTQMTVAFEFTPTGTAGANDWFEVGDVQLEIGEATPFELRPLAEEELACQRYFFAHIPASTMWRDAYVNDGNPYVIGQVFFPTTMRANPTVTLKGSMGHSNNESGGDASAQAPSVSKNHAAAAVRASSAGRTYSVWNSFGTDGVGFHFDAEL